MRNWAENPTLRRLVACLFGGFVLALMIGNQEGSQNDFGIAFREATSTPRLLGFLAVGFGVFLLLTFWPRIAPAVTHPGAAAVGSGFILSLAGMTLTRWYDPVGKFASVSTAVSKSHGVPFLVSLFFSPFGWVLLIVCLVLGGVAVATRTPAVGYAEFGLGIVAAVVVFVAHAQLVTFANGIDHTLGVYLTSCGYLVSAAGGWIAARSHAQTAQPLESIDRAMDWRPGFPVAAIALVVGLNCYLNTAWFAPLQLDADFAKTASDFHGEGLPQFAVAYLNWLGITLFVLAIVAALVGSLLRSKPVGWATVALGGAGLVLTFATLDRMSKIGSAVVPNYGETWQNLGAGGWLACLVFALVMATGYLTVTGANSAVRAAEKSAEPGPAPAARGLRAWRAQGRSGLTRTVVPVAIALALFYPPTLPDNWQNVIVTQIAAYLVLAVGLNVVIGWAGLLDLGYIAFYGIGSYTVAYFTGSLPLKPPDFLHLSPLLAIPFAVLACVLAGVLLGFPTLRLRGDYLAIVTLGFGEIVQIFAINNPGNLTGGPVGPRVPHPVIKVGPVHVTFGLDNLPYWYLLIALLGIVVFLFYRLEGSRLGRAWAAIREDEVAAQATGIHTARAKLLAFAIGASTSGIAGVFFATQVGYFDPSNFTIQNSILIVAFVVFGGMGSLAGVIAGAFVLTWLPYFLQSQVPLPDSQLWIGALVIVMMIFRPAGLIPARRRRAELTGLDAPATSEVRAVPVSEGI